MGKRLNAQREWQLLSWFLAQYRSKEEIWMNVRVGPIAPGLVIDPNNPAAMAAAGVTRRWVDTITFDGSRLSVIEAKLRADPGLFSQLDYYGRLVRIDPEFRAMAAKGLELLAVVATIDMGLQAIAPDYGVKIFIYRPPWLTPTSLLASRADGGLHPTPTPSGLPRKNFLQSG